jgi:hypothetical protein
MDRIKKFESFEYPDDIPTNLDKERLYASRANSKPGERLRNFLSPMFTYFSILEDESMEDKDKEKLLKGMAEQCVELLPYIKYWLRKVE